jgi:hypothetical protein
MNRRAVLAALGTATTALAGCLGSLRDDTNDNTHDSHRNDSSNSHRDSTTDSTLQEYDTSLAAQGIPSTICSEAIKRDPGIYAIDDPAFARDWSAHAIPARYRTVMDGNDLKDEHTVVGLEADGDARAYPLEVLTVHEVVNDEFGGPVLVTYCPICRSGMVADRVVDGDATTFAVSGLLWRPERIQVAGAEQGNRTFGAERNGGEQVSVRASGNVVVYDFATGSYWSQILAQAICGPKTGTSLTIRPSTLTTWGEWRREHPETAVLLPEPHSGTYRGEAFAGRTPDAPSSSLERHRARK